LRNSGTESVNHLKKKSGNDAFGLYINNKFLGIHRYQGKVKVQELIKEFMAQKRFAVVVATDNPQKYGNQIVKNLQKRGYEVYPVNPKLTEL
jgi:hypothetical protein